MACVGYGDRYPVAGVEPLDLELMVAPVPTARVTSF